MTLQVSPLAISLGDIQGEFSGTNPISIGEYIRGGTYVPNTTQNAAIKTTQANMAFSDYYGTAAQQALSVVSANITPSSLSEGATFTLTVNTANAPNGTVLYWTMVGTGTYPASGGDVTVSTGTVTINSNTGSTTIGTSDNIETPATPNVQFYVQIREGSLTGTVLGTSNTVTISEVWDSVALLGHSVFGSSIGTGGTVTSSFSLLASGVARGTTAVSGTTFNVGTIDGANSTSVDFPGQWYVSGQDKTQYSARGTWSGTDGTTSGPASGAWVTIGSTNRTWALASTNSNAARNLVVDIAPTSDTSTILASNTIQFQSNAGSYTATITSTTPTSVAETGSFNVVVATNLIAVPNGSTLFWTLLGTGTNPAVSGDLVQGGSGSFTTTGTSTTLTFTAAQNADNPYSASKTLQIQIRTGSTNGTVIATSSTVTINEITPAIVDPGVINVTQDRTPVADTSAFAGYTFRADGTIYKSSANSDNFNTTFVGNWISPSTFPSGTTGANYTIQFRASRTAVTSSGVSAETKYPGGYFTISSPTTGGTNTATTGYPSSFVSVGTLSTDRSFGIQASGGATTDWNRDTSYTFEVYIFETSQQANGRVYTFVANAIADNVTGPQN